MIIPFENKKEAAVSVMIGLQLRLKKDGII